MKPIKVFLALMVILVMTVLAGCGPVPTDGLDQATQDKLKQAEALHTTQKLKEMTFSVELANIIQRINVSNDPKQVGWVYLIDNGAIMSRMPVRGKVTSGNKRLSSTQMLKNCDGGEYNADCVMEAPDETGAYGSSNPYIFFFTPAGMLVQWQGNYLYTSEPYKLNPQAKTIEYTIDPDEMAKVAEYKRLIETTPLDKAKGGQ